jgi:hypothetical protein
LERFKDFSDVHKVVPRLRLATGVHHDGEIWVMAYSTVGDAVYAQAVGEARLVSRAKLTLAHAKAKVLVTEE